MKTARLVSLVLVLALLVGALAGCGGNVVQNATDTNDPGGTTPGGTQPQGGGETTPAGPAVEDKTDLTEHVSLRLSIANGNKSRTITYNQESPITLPDGTQVTAGMLKPVWTYVAEQLNIDITDVTIQDQKGSEMIQTASTNAFADANLYGGESICSDFMYYGSEGMFVSLSDMMDQGYMPNFKAYLDANPSIRDAITAYDGNVYFAPYIAPLDIFSKVFVARQTWVTDLLDAAGANYDTADFTTYYNGFYVGSNARTGDNGGTVTPKEGVNIVKKTNQNIIEIQNALSVKNGKTLTEAFIQYIKDNYDYDKPSELFLGEKAAYDIDELVALWRCIKANPTYLTNGRANTVWPLFYRQSSYREDLLYLGTYLGGVKAFGSDTHGARWYIDENGQIQYTYSSEGIYNTLWYLSQMEAEGLIYSDLYDTTNKTNFRSTLWGTDNGDSPSFGFMTFDFQSSSTSDGLNTDTVVMLPPVADINGVWQYYIDVGRAIKDAGWAVSVAGCKSDAEVYRSCALVDYFFSEKGSVVQNYGPPQLQVEGQYYDGPDGVDYPLFNDWVVETANNVSKGDVSTLLRDWIGAILPIGYQSSMGYEYQTTSQRGMDGWDLLLGSTTGYANYDGQRGKPGDNPNYYKFIPTAFSLTSRQQEELANNSTVNETATVEYMMNIIRYGVKGGAPDGVTIPKSYDEYLQYFKNKGLDTFVSVYQQAYAVMTAGN